MKRYLKYIWLMLPIIVLAACVEEYSLEGNPPTEAEANFSFQPTADSDNILRFTADNDFFIMNWDLGNGATGTGKTIILCMKAALAHKFFPDMNILFVLFINEINEQTSPQLTSEQLWRMLQLKIREFT
mgnify:CR=1 FL=1